MLGHQAVLSAEIVEMIVCIFKNCLLFSVCSISLAASVMVSRYGKLSSYVVTIRERERAAVNTQENVLTLAGLEIVPSSRI